MSTRSKRSSSTPDRISQDSGYNSGMAVFSYIIGGILVWGLIGWGLDAALNTRWIVLAGALFGALGGFYLSAKHGFFKSKPDDSSVKDESSPKISK